MRGKYKIQLNFPCFDVLMNSVSHIQPYIDKILQNIM